MASTTDEGLAAAGRLPIVTTERNSVRWVRIRFVLLALAALWTVQRAAATAQLCVGDCNEGGSVTVDELLTGVNIALGISSVDRCASFDTNGDNNVTVDEILTAVNNALSGCPRGELTFDKISLAVFPGGQDTVNVIAEDEDGVPVAWTVGSSAPRIVSVLKTGFKVQVTGVSLGYAVITVTTQSGLRRSVPVRVYDPTVLDVGGILIKYVDTFECIPGSPTPFAESFYRPVVPEGWYALGSFRVGENGCPNIDGQQSMMVVKEDPATSFDESISGDLPSGNLDDPPRALQLAAGDNQVRGSVDGADQVDSFSFTLKPGEHLNSVILSHFAGTWGEVRFFAGTDTAAPPPAFLDGTLMGADQIGANYLSLLGLDLGPGVYTIAIVAGVRQEYALVLNIGAHPATPPLVAPKYYQAQVGHFGWLLWAPVCPQGYIAMGTVVTTYLGDDTPPPAVDEATCVRKDLSVPAPLPTSAGFYTARIEAPDNSHYEDTTAYLETGTMSVVFPTGETNPYPVANVLAVELPLLIDTAYPDRFPRLTGFREPPDFSEPVMAKALLVPFTILNGDAYAQRGVAWMVENSPFVRVERVQRWERLFYNYNQSGTVQNHSVSFTKGITTENSTSISQTTGVSLTVESGWSLLGTGGKVSATVSYQFGYESQHSVGEFEESTTTISINVLPGTAAAAWRAQSTILVKLHDPPQSRFDEMVRQDVGDSLTTVNDDYPH